MRGRAAAHTPQTTCEPLSRDESSAAAGAAAALRAGAAAALRAGDAAAASAASDAASTAHAALLHRGRGDRLGLRVHGRRRIRV